MDQQEDTVGPLTTMTHVEHDLSGQADPWRFRRTGFRCAHDLATG